MKGICTAAPSRPHGMTCDFEALARAGIGGVQMFDAGCAIPPSPLGPVLLRPMIKAEYRCPGIRRTLTGQSAPDTNLHR